MLQAGTGFVAAQGVQAQGFQAPAFQTPAISVVRVEWRAVLDQMRTEIGAVPAVAADFTFALQRRVPAFDPRSLPGLVQLNAVTSSIFTGIARSPVPVLLPFDAAAFAEAQRGGQDASLCRATRPISGPSTCSKRGLRVMTRCSRSSRARAQVCRSGPLPSRSRCRSPARP